MKRAPEQDPRVTLLALDTSGDVCSAALLRNGQLMGEHAFRHEMHLSERLTGHIDQVLKDFDHTLSDISAFAVGIGPGSFTGTRIGVMTLKTFAAIQQRPLYGVGGLEAMAAEYCGLPDAIVVPVLACRTGVVYTCPYRVTGPIPEPLAEPAALTFVELAALLHRFEQTRFLFCGPVAHRYTVDMRAALADRAHDALFGSVAFPRASTIAAIAHHRILTGLPPDDPIALVPLYISPPPITLPKQPIPAPPHTGVP